MQTLKLQNCVLWNLLKINVLYSKLHLPCSMPLPQGSGDRKAEDRRCTWMGLFNKAEQKPMMSILTNGSQLEFNFH